MTQITARITGDDKVAIGLKKLGDAIPALAARSIMAAMNKAKEEASAQWPVAAYAGYGVPYRPGQKYKRTGRYGSGFKVERNGPQNYTLQNRTPYAPFVGGDSEGQGQAWMHEGRWPVIRETVEKFIEPMVQQVDHDIDDAAEAFGL